MVIAGKLGLYSILRFSFGIFPGQSHRIAPLMLALGAIGIVYGALLALVQKDLKRLAAFGTLGHVSVVILGIFAFTVSGIDGGIYQTLNEGIGGGALLLRKMSQNNKPQAAAQPVKAKLTTVPSDPEPGEAKPQKAAPRKSPAKKTAGRRAGTTELRSTN